jgi:hypothetical protein
MKDISSGRGASSLVLSGELTEGTSDLSRARTAPGGIPALPEVNQDRSHPESPDVQEQPHANYRQLIRSGLPQPGAVSWVTTGADYRQDAVRPAGPAQQAAQTQRDQADALTAAHQGTPLVKQSTGNV